MEERLSEPVFSLRSCPCRLPLFRLARMVGGSGTLESGRRGVILHLSLGMQVPRPARGCSIIFFVVCVLGWFALWIDRNLFPRPLDHNLRPRLPDFLRVLSVGVGVTSSVEFAGGRQVRSKGGQKGESQSSSSSFRFVFRSLVVPRRACARRPARPGRGSAHPRYDSSGLSCCVLRKTYLCGQS